MNLQKEILDNLNKSSYERLTKPNNIKSIFEIFKVFIFITIVYFLLTINNIYCNIFSFIIVAGIQHRIYMIQHECTHYNLFNNKSLNSIIGSIFSYLIFFNWNYIFTNDQWDKSPYFIPHINKIVWSIFFFMYFFFRGFYMPLRRGVNKNFLFPYNWLKVSLIGLLIDLSKLPGRILGYFYFIKIKLSNFNK